MDNRQRTWTLLAAAFSFIVGFILVMNDSAAGWFLIIVGLSYIGTSTRTGQEWAESKPASHGGCSLELHCCSSSSSSLVAQSFC